MTPSLWRHLWSYSLVMERGFVLCPTSPRRVIGTHRPDMSPVCASRVSPSLLADGRRPTPWGRVGLTILPGPRPMGCSSWGLWLTPIELQQNCWRITDDQPHPSHWRIKESRCHARRHLNLNVNVHKFYFHIISDSLVSIIFSYFKRCLCYRWWRGSGADRKSR